MEKARNSYTTMILIMVFALPLCFADSYDGICFADFYHGTCAAPLMGGAAPSVEDIINDSVVNASVHKAWEKSNLGNGLYKINGGWVYAHSKDPSKLIVLPADKCRSRPGSVEEAEINSELVEIYLDYPENDHSEPLNALIEASGYKLVADFHTHPFPGVYQTPDTGDVIRAYNRDVPSLVYSCSGIF
eukprot:Gb_23168 [translate_table: standard]